MCTISGHPFSSRNNTKHLPMNRYFSIVALQCEIREYVVLLAEPRDGHDVGLVAVEHDGLFCPAGAVEGEHALRDVTPANVRKINTSPSESRLALAATSMANFTLKSNEKQFVNFLV